MEVSDAVFDVIATLDPDRCWEVSAYGDVYRDHHSDVARIRVLFREFQVSDRSKAAGSRLRQFVSVPLGELAALPPGSIWKGGRQIGDSPQERRVELEVGPPLASVENLSNYWSAAALLRAGFPEDAVDELMRSRWTRHQVLWRSKRFLGEYVLLPCPEVYRRTFGLATDLSLAVFNRRLLHDDDLRARLTLGDPSTIKLPKYMTDDSSRLLAHYILTPAMQMSACFLTDQYINDFTELGDRAPLSMPPPFDYPLRLTVRGRRFQTLSGYSVFVARRLIAADVKPVVPARLEIERDHPVPEVTGVVPGTPSKPEEKKPKPSRKSRNPAHITNAEPAGDALSHAAIETEENLFRYLDDVVIVPVYERTPCVRGPAGADKKDEDDPENAAIDTAGTTAPARSYGKNRPVNLVPLDDLHHEQQPQYAFRYLRKLLPHLKDLPRVAVRALMVDRTIPSDIGPINLFPGRIHSGTFSWAVIDRSKKHFRQCMVLEIRKGNKQLYLFEPQLRHSENRCMRVFANPQLEMLPLSKLSALLHAFMWTKAMSVAQAIASSSDTPIPAITVSSVLGVSEHRFEHAEAKDGFQRTAERIMALFDHEVLPPSSLITQTTPPESAAVNQESTA